METANLIDFLIKSGVLHFGSFKTKSGRRSPYFFNFGAVNRGLQIKELSLHYAQTILETKLKPDIIFGPAYKGIPLSVGIAAALEELDPLNSYYFSFDRKEQKDHGEGGTIVGKQPLPGERLVIVEDVVTAGTTLKEIVPTLRSIEGVEIVGVVICVDRQERIQEADSVSAKTKLEQDLQVPILPLLTIEEILVYLSSDNSSGFKLSDDQILQTQNYLKQYGDIDDL